MESTADVFAAYLGMTPENAGWAYAEGERCLECGCTDERTDDGECQNCNAYCFEDFETFHTLTATSPLAPAPTPGWLERLVIGSHRIVLYGPSIGSTECIATLDGVFEGAESTHPTHAVARALIAADPALRARLEACGDWEGVKHG